MKMFYFSCANHASTNLKKFFELKTWQDYFIYQFPCRMQLGISLQTGCVSFFPLSWHFKKSLFGINHIFCVTRTDYACKTWLGVQRDLYFLLVKLIYKSNRKHFFMYLHSLILTPEGLPKGEFSTVMQTQSRAVSINFSQPLSCLHQAMQTWETFCIA